MTDERPPMPATVFDETNRHYQRGYDDGLQAARQLDPGQSIPPCSRCFKTDRMTPAGTFPLDWGGKVGVVVCQRCGVVGLILEGTRPEPNTTTSGQSMMPGMPRRMDGH